MRPKKRRIEKRALIVRRCFEGNFARKVTTRPGNETLVIKIMRSHDHVEGNDIASNNLYGFQVLQSLKKMLACISASVTSYICVTVQLLLSQWLAERFKYKWAVHCVARHYSISEARSRPRTKLLPALVIDSLRADDFLSSSSWMLSLERALLLLCKYCFSSLSILSFSPTKTVFRTRNLFVSVYRTRQFCTRISWW